MLVLVYLVHVFGIVASVADLAVLTAIVPHAAPTTIESRGEAHPRISPCLCISPGLVQTSPSFVVEAHGPRSYQVHTT